MYDVRCLTEPQCGSDLGQVTTSASPNGDGSYKLNGTKIFISCGEHDMTENIVHCVSAARPIPNDHGRSLIISCVSALACSRMAA